jgi:hypothetical protein
MFEFIPNNLSSREAFAIIDEFYDGWFDSQNITFDDVLKYYPGADNWDRGTLFSGLLWMYYNYPMDYLAKMGKVPGAKLFRKANFWRVVCFLVQSNMNEPVTLSVLNTLIDSNLKGQYPAAKDKDALQLGDAIESGGFPNAEEAVIIDSKDLNHPFSRNTKAGKVPLAGLKKRIKKGIIFTNKAIAADKELLPQLNFEFMKLISRKGEKRDVRRAERVRQQDSELRREKERSEKVGVLDRLMDQINPENLSVQKQRVPQYTEEPKLRHKVTTKPFVPFVFEEIDLDIDPNLIADKINELTSPIRSEYSFGSSKRSEFSVNDDSVLSNWDDESSIEI